MFHVVSEKISPIVLSQCDEVCFFFIVFLWNFSDCETYKCDNFLEYISYLETIVTAHSSQSCERSRLSDIWLDPTFIEWMNTLVVVSLRLRQKKKKKNWREKNFLGQKIVWIFHRFSVSMTTLSVYQPMNHTNLYKSSSKHVFLLLDLPLVQVWYWACSP